MGEHPTVTIEGKEMELIEFSRARNALISKRHKIERELDKIKENPQLDSHDLERELNIINGALETFDDVLSDYKKEYGEYEVEAMIT